MKKQKKSSDYAKIFAEYPETLRVVAEDVGDAPMEPIIDLPDVGGDAPAPEAPVADDSAPVEEEEDAPQLFDAEKLRADLSAALATATLEELGHEGNYTIMVDSIGEAEQAKEFLKAESADAEELLRLGNDALSGVAAQLELPGQFELVKSEPDPEAEEPEPETFDVFYAFSDEDLDKLIELGFEFASSAEEASFEEIISSLAESGHEDVARRIYDILNPARKH